MSDSTGRCLSGYHHNCAHSVGGPQEAGLLDPDTGKLWRCSCDCHPEQMYAPSDKWLKSSQAEEAARIKRLYAVRQMEARPPQNDPAVRPPAARVDQVQDSLF